MSEDEFCSKMLPRGGCIKSQTVTIILIEVGEGES